MEAEALGSSRGRLVPLWGPRSWIWGIACYRGLVLVKGPSLGVLLTLQPSVVCSL